MVNSFSARTKSDTQHYLSHAVQVTYYTVINDEESEGKAAFIIMLSYLPNSSVYDNIISRGPYGVLTIISLS